MNLTTLFNFDFLKENMKKSKAIILLCVFLVPVINVIIYLMRTVNGRTYIPSLFDMSTLSVVGMYVIPVILSITLFSFVYKRKSSDFVMSFPVTKRQIFLSNTLGGILVIIVMNIINLLFLLVSTLLLSNVLIDFRMLFDMFILWVISYIFVFVSTNIAVSVSSNKITTVVVTLLILFLVPFVHTFIVSDYFRGDDNIVWTYCDNEACTPVNYQCDSTTCEINKKNNIYMYTGYVEVVDNNYTLPYALIVDTIFGFNSNYKVNNSLIKMSIISILYIIIGLLLFNRRKFEIVETSFKSEKIHILVRSLTLIPIICIYYIILKNSSIGFSDLFTIVFLLALVITYIIIYDLITRRKIINVFKSLASLIIVGILVIFTGELSSDEEEILKVDDIETLTFLDYDLSTSEGYTKDKDIINYIMGIHMENVGNDYYYEFFNIMASTDDFSYRFQIAVTKEQYDYIIDSLKKDKDYLSFLRNIEENDVFAIEIGSDTHYISKDDKLYGKLIEKFKKEGINAEAHYNEMFDVKLITYDDFNVGSVSFNVYEDKEFMEEILNYYNKQVSIVFDSPNVRLDSYYYGNIDNEVYLSSYNQDYTSINKFILDNLDSKVDVNKPFMFIRFYDYSSYANEYIFVTNKVEELKEIILRLGNKDDKSLGDK